MLCDDLRESGWLGTRPRGPPACSSHPGERPPPGAGLAAGPPSRPWQHRSRRPSRAAAGTSPPAGRPRRCKRGCPRTWGRAAVSAARPPPPAPGCRWSCPRPAQRPRLSNPRDRRGGAAGLQAAGGHSGVAACGGPPRRRWVGGGDGRKGGDPGLDLLVEGDVVEPHAHLPGEEVGAVVAVLQEAPAERGARQRVERVSGAAQAQSRAGGSQTLGAGVVVVQEAWAGGTPSPHPRAGGAAATPSQIRRTPGGRPAHLARSWTRCQSRGGPARSTSRNSTWKRA